jgi:hypothetical protein
MAHDDDFLLTLQQVALITDTPLRTLENWTHGEGAPMAHEHTGLNRQVKVRVSVVARWFPRGCLRLERLRDQMNDHDLKALRAVLDRP